MTETSTKSAEISAFAEAMAKAQGAIKGARKDSANPFFNSSYADLASCWEACRIPLSSNGLSVIQMPERNGDEVVVTTLLLHVSGQWVSSSLAGKPTKLDPQGIGSAITYLRRYALSAMVGIAPEDDDGNAASQPSPRERLSAEPKQPAPAPKRWTVAEAIAKINACAIAPELSKLTAELRAMFGQKGPDREKIAAALSAKKATLGEAPACPECGSTKDAHAKGCPMGPEEIQEREPGAEG